jgi:hypothetical protein
MLVTTGQKHVSDTGLSVHTNLYPYGDIALFSCTNTPGCQTMFWKCSHNQFHFPGLKFQPYVPYIKHLNLLPTFTRQKFPLSVVSKYMYQFQAIFVETYAKASRISLRRPFRSIVLGPLRKLVTHPQSTVNCLNSGKQGWKCRLLFKYGGLTFKQHKGGSSNRDDIYIWFLPLSFMTFFLLGNKRSHFATGAWPQCQSLRQISEPKFGKPRDVITKRSTSVFLTVCSTTLYEVVNIVRN